MRHNISEIIFSLLAIVLLSSCQEELLAPAYDYSRAGEPVTLTLTASLPKMEVKSRANLNEAQLNQIDELWVRTYSAVTKKATSEWKKITIGTETYVEYPDKNSETFEIETLSGSNYIIAVANVDNLAVTKDAPGNQVPLGTLLDDADTWDKFLNIAVVAPSSYEEVNAPTPPLPMAGAYTNIKVGDHTGSTPAVAVKLEEWSHENFQPYTIPASESGTVTLDGGAIHMRRLVSKINFNLSPGNDNITVTPNSYSIVNVPKYTWLYERDSEHAEEVGGSRMVNFGDMCSDDTASDFYASTAQYPSGSFSDNGDGSWSFNFWQAENKHRSMNTITYYDERQKQKKDHLDDVAGNPDDEQYEHNTGLFTTLTGDVWTPNNMATYVLVNCHIDYKNQINVGDDGQIPGTTPVYRSGTANYLIHLGYMDNDANDFNCYRNVDYTYNVTVNGIDDIRVEAFHDGETPGVDGIVADVNNPTIHLDCHYQQFNIELTPAELAAWDPADDSGFGFIITTYDNSLTSGREQTFQERDFADFADYNAFVAAEPDKAKYVNWVEIRATTGEDVFAEYSPRGDGSGLTFNLIDAAKGISDAQRSASGWYTVFVNEYTYECDGADERASANGGRNVWQSYVNADVRRFYIRVNRSISADGESMYARSKYAASQQSIMSYYSDQVSTEAIAGSTQESGSAIGVEHSNESFGLNLRRSFTEAIATDRNNGRYNCWQSTRYRYNRQGNRYSWQEADNNELNSGWSYFVDQSRPLEIPAFSGHDAKSYSMPSIMPFRGTATSDQYSPQSGSASSTNYNFIEAISACMNRNRDNNGNGVIEPSEMRWYVPAISKYLRIFIGSGALQPDQLVDYQNMPSSRPNGISNDNWGEYRFFASEGTILWAMEGLSTSAWSGTAPWQVRCIRNLGTNLGAEVQEGDRTVPAYEYIANNTSNPNAGGRVIFTYYAQNSLRANAFNANGPQGNTNNRMPVHLISDDNPMNSAANYNSLYRGGFEIASGNRYEGSTFYYNGTGKITPSPNSWIGMINLINTDITGNNSPNPCTALGQRWRLPNIKELAIMKNLGFFDDCPSDSYVLSCSIGVYGANGSKVEANTNSSIEHYFMSASSALVTQAWKNSYYIRCVRDYIGN